VRAADARSSRGGARARGFVTKMQNPWAPTSSRGCLSRGAPSTRGRAGAAAGGGLYNMYMDVHVHVGLSDPRLPRTKRRGRSPSSRRVCACASSFARAARAAQGCARAHTLPLRVGPMRCARAAPPPKATQARSGACPLFSCPSAHIRGIRVGARHVVPSGPLPSRCLRPREIKFRRLIHWMRSPIPTSHRLPDTTFQHARLASGCSPCMHTAASDHLFRAVALHALLSCLQALMAHAGPAPEQRRARLLPHARYVYPLSPARARTHLARSHAHAHASHRIR
jgi:hypothetical protein